MLLNEEAKLYRAWRNINTEIIFISPFAHAFKHFTSANTYIQYFDIKLVLVIRPVIELKLFEFIFRLPILYKMFSTYVSKISSVTFFHNLGQHVKQAGLGILYFFS